MNAEDAELLQLATRLGDALKDAGHWVATAESCTGGWVAKVLTDVPGSSRWFSHGLVTYGNGAKTQLLQVPESVLAAEGAVSEATVRAMAEGAQALAGADYAVAVSGVAGPDGGTEDKPVGTVWFAWVGPHNKHRTDCRNFPGDREAVRRASVAWALHGVLAMAEAT